MSVDWRSGCSQDAPGSTIVFADPMLPGRVVISHTAGEAGNLRPTRLHQRRLSDCYALVDLPRIPDRRGSLTFIEGTRHIPFAIARVYYLYDVPADAERAGHAHYELQQLIIALSGSFNVSLDNGMESTTVHLNRPYRGLLLRPMLWRTINEFSAGATCLVVASMLYDEADYIRDYHEFVRLVRES